MPASDTNSAVACKLHAGHQNCKTHTLTATSLTFLMMIKQQQQKMHNTSPLKKCAATTSELHQNCPLVFQRTCRLLQVKLECIAEPPPNNAIMHTHTHRRRSLFISGKVSQISLSSFASLFIFLFF